jgi:outer membrane biosynthesis protein TonB
MRTIHRVVLLTILATFASALTACSDFDPDKLDVFGLSEKKKLPGERKEVFPGGVPGVTQGIPPEFVKGNQPSTEAAQTPASATEPDKKTAAVEPEPKPKPKRPPKPRTVSQPTQITVQPAPQQQPAPWPQAQQPAQQQSQAPWPAQEQTNTAEPWPSSPQPGTFSR